MTSVLLAEFAIFAAIQWRQVEIGQIRALSKLSEALFASNQKLEGMCSKPVVGR